MERLTYVTEDGEILFHPEDLPDDEGLTITQLAEDGRFDALEAIAERLANRECMEEMGLLVRKSVVRGWIPVSERLPDDGDVRFYMCIVENHEEDLPMFCQYEEDRGFGFWRDYYDADTLGFVDSEFQTNEELGYEKVVAWMPLPEPYRESEVDHGEV